MVGPECCTGFDEDFETFIMELTDGNGLDGSFEYRDLKFVQMPYDSAYICMDIYRDMFVAIKDDQTIVMIVDNDEIFFTTEDSGDIAVESFEDLDKFLDEYVFN